MKTMNVHLTPTSRNAKTGPIPVSTSPASTCPEACPFKAGGCYANGGPLKMHWNKVSSGERGTQWDSFCNTIAALPEGQVWRHNQAGDLPGNGETVNFEQLWSLTVANKGKRGFTYTHYDVENNDHNREAVETANLYRFTINLSANTLAHADRLAALNIAPVVVVLPSDWTENTRTPEGHKVVVCPATAEGSTVTCASCKLCAVRENRPIIGFPAHGASKRKASAVASMEATV